MIRLMKAFAYFTKLKNKITTVWDTKNNSRFTKLFKNRLEELRDKEYILYYRLKKYRNNKMDVYLLINEIDNN